MRYLILSALLGLQLTTTPQILSSQPDEFTKICTVRDKIRNGESFIATLKCSESTGIEINIPLFTPLEEQLNSLTDEDHVEVIIVIIKK